MVIPIRAGLAVTKTIMLTIGWAALVESTATGSLIALPEEPIIDPEQVCIDDQSPPQVSQRAVQSISLSASVLMRGL